MNPSSKNGPPGLSNAPFFDPAHRAWIKTLTAFTRPNAVHLDREEEAGAVPLVHLLAEAGLIRPVVPKNFASGGIRLDARALCLTREHLAYHSSLADTMFAMQGLGSYPITFAGSAALKKRILPQVVAGKAVMAFALTEPEAGSDAGAISTQAKRKGKRYILNGHKTFISNAGIADYYTVFAKTDKDEISAFLLEKGTPGLVQHRKIELIAPHPIGEIKFKNCEVSADHRLGREGEGYEIAMKTLELFRASVAAAALGMAQRAFDEACRHARERRQFGRPIGDFQGIRFMLAEMKAELDASRLLVYRAAWKYDVAKEPVGLETSIAKFYATEAAQRIIDRAVQIHGGQGVVKGNVVERLYREIRALRLYEGTSEIQKLIIAKHILR